MTSPIDHLGADRGDKPTQYSRQGDLEKPTPANKPSHNQVDKLSEIAT